MDRIVDIATDGQHLSAHRGFLLVQRDGEEIGRVPLDDIHAVIVHAHGVTWSGTLVARLAERGAPIVFCGANHAPVAVTLPLEGHHAQAARMQAQMNASRPLAKQLWRRIVSAKIAMQGSLLAARGVEGAQAFAFMARRVTSGDKENLEAQAARRYWPLLMGRDFRRDRDAAGANALLNYGYAVMRAACARAVVAAGLHPTLGIQHSNRGNAFALADDLIEPFRPLVDGVAERLVRAGVVTLDPAVKRRFARLIAFDVRIGDEASPVSVAAQRLARSLARAFETGRAELALFDPPSPVEWAAATAPDLDPSGT
ncbi:MAG: type II CRISPR-associated endonuclease Cas1 [Caulobacterales bacterium]|nr:type II CRISPR-associated endonuclease Cas1 [Caulobacterales bacterium]